MKKSILNIVKTIMTSILFVFIIVASILQWNPKFHTKTYDEASLSKNLRSYIASSYHFQNYVEHHQGDIEYEKD